MCFNHFNSMLNECKKFTVYSSKENILYGFDALFLRSLNIFTMFRICHKNVHEIFGYNIHATAFLNMLKSNVKKAIKINVQ